MTIVRISALVVAIMVAIAYAPLMFALRSWNGSQGRWYVFPVAGIVPGLAPVLITSSWRIAQPYLAPAATSCLFVTFGIAFGTGFYLTYVRPSTSPTAVEAAVRSARGAFRGWMILPVAVTVVIGGFLAHSWYTFYQPERLFVSMHSQVRPG